MRRWIQIIASLFVIVPCMASAAEVVVSVDPSRPGQEIDGFGASLTDSSAWLLRHGIPSSLASNVLRQLFCPTNGIGLSFLRQPMGASDFRLQDYTYDDMPPGQTDYALTNFSIRYDTNYITPLLRQIAGINTNLKIMATPWSPPAWMKTSDHLYYGTLKTNAYSALAAYFRKFIQAYAAEGLSIHSVTLQNEPLLEPYSYPGMAMTVSNQIELARLMGADFASNGISTKILVYDHNWDQFNFAISVLNDTGVAAVAAGSAFHGYNGDPSVQSLVHDAHPDKDIYLTECSSGAWSGSFTNSLMWDVENLVIGAIRHGAKAVIKWNLVLDQNGGPKLGGGCETCRGLLTINTNTFAITTNSEYYALAHVSRFLRPGARRVASDETAAEGPYSVAFQNPDTSLVAVVYNPSVVERDFTMRCQGESFNYRLPALSVATFTWPAVAGATVDVWLTTASKTKLLEKQSGVVRFAPTSFIWKGWTWSVGDTRGGPGNNFRSASCVQVDTNGWLHLGVQSNNGVWFSSQVESEGSPGFGTYRWYVIGRPDQLNSNLVAGLATYFDAYRALGIEFSRSYEEAPTNFFYSVEPYYLENHRFASALSLTGTLTTHELTWTPRRAAFRSWYGHAPEPPSPSAVFAQWSYEGADVPGDTNEHIRMNLWMFDGLAPASSQEFVLADFTYQCVTGVFLRDDFEDGVLSNIWQRFNDPSNHIDETGGELNVSPADADGNSVGIRTVSDLKWADDGLSYLFTVNLASMVVTRSRTEGGADVWVYQALVSGSNGLFDPYSASNAIVLRAGYDASDDQLAVELLTKTATPGSWGTSRFLGTVDRASSLFGGAGLDLIFALVYSNYEVSVTRNGAVVAVTTVSGSPTGMHNLAEALYTARYVAGVQNHDDGRGTAHLGSVERSVCAVLPSTAGGDGDAGPGTTVVQLGDGNASATWHAPIDCTYTRHRAMVLYKADDIGRSGSITQLWINVLSVPDIALSNYTVRLQHTALDSVGATFVNSGWTTVYHANVSFPTGYRGWYGLPFIAPYEYNAASNLLVDFVFQDAVKDSSPSPAATYTPTAYNACFVVSSDRNDPFTWTTAPSGKKYQFNGARIVDIRLAFPNEPPAPIGENMSFEDGPPGFLTNVPSWHVEGSAYAGLVKAGVAYHGGQSLKLWKNGGEGHQKLYQFFEPALTNEYTLTGYILSQSGEPFGGVGAYGALVFDWYGATGLLRSDESAHFTVTNTYNVWHPFTVSAVPPPGTTSGRFACVLVSSPDQEGSLFFDRLEIQAIPSSTTNDVEPVLHTSFLSDEFNDTTMSNCWQRAGNFLDTVYEETNGTFRIRPGTNWAWQSSGYVSVNGIPWNNTSAWWVFSATLATVKVDAVSGTNDIAFLLGIVSEGDNPWYVTNSVGLYGYYNAADNSIFLQLLMKTDRPMQSGNERFSAIITNARSYFGSTNGLRISIALGRNQYDLRLSDRSGYPVPYALNAGASRGLHYLGDALTNGRWYVGAQNEVFKRGDVFWDRAHVYVTEEPGAAIAALGQTSSDGSGIVTISNVVWDANGDPCRLRIEANTDGGVNWWGIIGSTLTSSLPAILATNQQMVQVIAAVTTNASGFTASNIIVLTWDTQAAGLAGQTFTNVRIRLYADDGDVGAPVITSQPFAVDNQPPTPSGAIVTLEGGAAYTFDTTLEAAWSGFTDAGSDILGYYLSFTNRETTSDGIWTSSSPASLSGAVPDTSNTVFVWGKDIYGNIGNAASASILVLNPNTDYDADGLTNSEEETYGASPVKPDTDEDGMPDGWEVAHGFLPAGGADAEQDADEDGYRNRDEYFFGTDPLSATSRLLFHASTASGNAWRVSWSAATGRVYNLYYADAPGYPWQGVPAATNLPGVGTIMTHTSSASEVNFRIYRLGVRFP